MANKNNNSSKAGNDKDLRSRSTERQSSVPNDLPDSPHDEERLKGEETVINLPDVTDIPGQEKIRVPPLGELADTTISSDDEEGVGVFDLDDSEDLTAGTDADVSIEEKRTLANSNYMPTNDEDSLFRAAMDNSDFQGDELNVRGFGESRTGSDLDVPGSEADDRNERIGEEDEENNPYSISDNEDENFPAQGPS